MYLRSRGVNFKVSEIRAEDITYMHIANNGAGSTKNDVAKEFKQTTQKFSTQAIRHKKLKTTHTYDGYTEIALFPPQVGPNR